MQKVNNFETSIPRDLISWIKSRYLIIRLTLISETNQFTLAAGHEFSGSKSCLPYQKSIVRENYSLDWSEDVSRLQEKVSRLFVSAPWDELTILWNDLTILWNDLTIDWNDLTWNNLTMERNDRIVSGEKKKDAKTNDFRISVWRVERIALL